MKARLPLDEYPSPACFEPGTARTQASAESTELQGLLKPINTFKIGV